MLFMSVEKAFERKFIFCIGVVFSNITYLCKFPRCMYSAVTNNYLWPRRASYHFLLHQSQKARILTNECKNISPSIKWFHTTSKSSTYDEEEKCIDSETSPNQNKEKSKDSKKENQRKAVNSKKSPKETKKKNTDSKKSPKGTKKTPDSKKSPKVTNKTADSKKSPKVEEKLDLKSNLKENGEECVDSNESPKVNGKEKILDEEIKQLSDDENSTNKLLLSPRSTARKVSFQRKKNLKEEEEEEASKEEKDKSETPKSTKRKNAKSVNGVKEEIEKTPKSNKKGKTKNASANDETEIKIEETKPSRNKKNVEIKENSTKGKKQNTAEENKVTGNNKKQSRKKVNRIVSDDEEEMEQIEESPIAADEGKTEKSDMNDSPIKKNTRVSKKRKMEKVEEDHTSSEDDAEISPVINKKRRKNVITDDDSPVKQVPNIFKRAKENYSGKLDQFIMKSKVENEKDDSSMINILMKGKSKKQSEEESKMDVDDNENKDDEVADKTGVTDEIKMKNISEKVKEDLTEDKQPKMNVLKNEKSSNKSSSDNSYCPSKNHYHPIDDAFWKKGEKVPYLALARTFEEIESISGRLKTIEALANFFRSVIVLSPDDLVHSVYLCLNRLAPEYHSIELGVGETLLMKAMAQATGRSVDKIKAEVASKGDLGLVAESSRANQRVMFGFPKLTILSVFTKFKEIAEMSGNAVMNKKISIMQGLFSACRDCEAKYIVRSLSGKLRIGLAEQSVLTALGQAVTITPPGQEYPPKILNATRSMSEKEAKQLMDSQILILKTTYCECPNYDVIIPIMLDKGVSELPNHCYLTPGIPLKPMLAHPANSIDQVLNRFAKNETKDEKVEFTSEFKYDGERAQIHRLEDGSVKIYSRNQEDNTTKYPDVIERFSNSLVDDVKSCILDSEIVAWDTEAQQIKPFQILSTRKRKDAAQSEIKVQVCVIAFDLLYLNGESLVKKPLFDRRTLLHKSFKEVPNEFAFTKFMDSTDTEVIQSFLDESIEGNCEGLMVKSLKIDATYEIAKRSHNWLKLKKDYLGGTADSFDLVVIGGWYGKGKRTGNYGGFLLACYDDETEEYQTICKIGTGFKDADFKEHSDFFNKHTIPRAKSDYRFDNSLQPDQWFDAVQVWEVKCADLSISPVHKAANGIVDPEKGISLRFPRFVRIRDDKKSEDATTATEVAERYNSQKQVQNQNPKDSKHDIEDFY